MFVVGRYFKPIKRGKSEHQCWVNRELEQHRHLNAICGIDSRAKSILESLMRKTMKIDTPRTFDPAFGVHLGIIPFDRSYWVVPGRLLAGLYPSSDDQGEASDKLQRLLGVGVRHVINLTEPVEKNWKGVPLSDYEPELKAIANQQKLQIACRRHKIRDLDVPTIDMMKLILNDIDEAMRASKAVYVHCWGGRGRTGVVVGCFLARHGNGQSVSLSDH
jgi:hypothetical protein